MSSKDSKNMQSEYRKKEENMINLYAILGLAQDVCEKPNCAEIIKSAYLEKSRLSHPDKNRDNQEMAEVFLLIQGAYEILSDAKLRSNYNNKLNMEKQSTGSFFKLKQTAAEYADAKYIEPSDQQLIDFKKSMTLANENRGHASFEEKPIPKKEAKTLLKDFVAGRDADLSYKPPQLFDDLKKDWDPRKFNAAFDMQKKQGHVNSCLSMMEAPDVPFAWNSGSSFGSFHGDNGFGNVEDPFDDSGADYGLAAQQFGKHDVGDIPQNTVTREMMDGIEGGDYFKAHNKLDEDYHASLKKKLSEREMDSKIFGKMKYQDYKREDMAGYGILDQIGYNDTERIGALDDMTVSERLDKIMKERALK